MIADYARAYGLEFGTLRSFNACGAAVDASIGEDHRPGIHLIPSVLQVALGRRDHVTVHGVDYSTPDGTCIRDYIHVEDLAHAHLGLLERVAFGRGATYNVGMGSGFSVRQVVEAVRRVTGRPIPLVESPRRPGDPPASSRPPGHSNAIWTGVRTSPRSKRSSRPHGGGIPPIHRDTKA